MLRRRVRLIAGDNGVRLEPDESPPLFIELPEALVPDVAILAEIPGEQSIGPIPVVRLDGGPSSHPHVLEMSLSDIEIDDGDGGVRAVPDTPDVRCTYCIGDDPHRAVFPPIPQRRDTRSTIL